MANIASQSYCFSQNLDTV